MPGRLPNTIITQVSDADQIVTLNSPPAHGKYLVSAKMGGRTGEIWVEGLQCGKRGEFHRTGDGGSGDIS